MEPQTFQLTISSPLKQQRLSLSASLVLPLFLAAPEMRDDPPLRRWQAWVGDGIAKARNIDRGKKRVHKAEHQKKRGKKKKRSKISESWKRTGSALFSLLGESLISAIQTKVHACIIWCHDPRCNLLHKLGEHTIKTKLSQHLYEWGKSFTLQECGHAGQWQERGRSNFVIYKGANMAVFTFYNNYYRENLQHMHLMSQQHLT